LEFNQNSSRLVRAGGGSLGAVEVGMPKALVGAGVHTNFVVGSLIR
jgi:predicted acylesterase/phospholipase RssA